LRLFAAIIPPATSNPPLANFSIATKKSYNFSLSESKPFSFSPPSRYPPLFGVQAYRNINNLFLTPFTFYPPQEVQTVPEFLK
jgi:hypothetical protein